MLFPRGEGKGGGWSTLARRYIGAQVCQIGGGRRGVGAKAHKRAGLQSGGMGRVGGEARSYVGAQIFHDGV